LELTTKLLRDFVNAVIYKPEEKKESNAYGIISENEDNELDVILDGAEMSTPCVPLVSCSSGDRVTVTIRDNTCYITGVL
jgi:hypothetical protein